MKSTLGRIHLLTLAIFLTASAMLVSCSALENDPRFDEQPQQIGALTVSGQQEAVTQQSGAAAQQGLPVNAVGRVELAREYKVSMEAGGKVSEVAVDIGDSVKVGDLLVSLDTADLERAVTRAEIDVETAGIAFEEAGKAIDESDIALAEANLLLAEENLAVVKRGPTQEQLESSENAAASAWSRYNELKAGPTEAELNQARANLAKAEVSVQAAQREYDKIAWLPEAAASAAADTCRKQPSTWNLPKLPSSSSTGLPTHPTSSRRSARPNRRSITSTNCARSPPPPSLPERWPKSRLPRQAWPGSPKRATRTNARRNCAYNRRCLAWMKPKKRWARRLFSRPLRARCSM
ncbi:MAG: biotin/lipoyl-binding protein [Caldilineaceae bacterium]|nr:biotin/lipoyl-binding protein [Caldilineaceae bacterium]